MPEPSWGGCSFSSRSFQNLCTCEGPLLCLSHSSKVGHCFTPTQWQLRMMNLGMFQNSEFTWLLCIGECRFVATFRRQLHTLPVLQPEQDDFAKWDPVDYCNNCRSYRSKWHELLQQWLVPLTQWEWISEKSCTMQYNQPHGLHGMMHDWCISNVCKGKRSAVRNCPKSRRLTITGTVHLECSPSCRIVATGAPQTNDTSEQNPWNCKCTTASALTDDAQTQGNRPYPGVNCLQKLHEKSWFNVEHINLRFNVNLMHMNWCALTFREIPHYLRFT